MTIGREETINIGKYSNIQPCIALTLDLHELKQGDIEANIKEAATAVKELWENQALDMLRGVIKRRARIAEEDQHIAEKIAECIKADILKRGDNDGR